jgi:hypothetical protein
LTLVVFTGIYFAGCRGSDPSSSQNPLEPTTAVVSTGHSLTVDGEEFLDELEFGTFTVCKVAEGSSTMFTFEIQAVGPGVGDAPVFKPEIQLGDGECDDVYVAAPFFEPDLVTITEVVPDGYQIDKIVVYSLEETDEDPDTIRSVHTGTATVEGSIDFGKLGCLVIYYNSMIPKQGGEGCTPGYWKNHIGSWLATGFSPTDNFDETFGVEMFGDDVSLCDALNQGGGGNYALGRHVVAALLNSSHPDVDYGLSPSEILAALDDGDKDLLEENNELGCPIGGKSEVGKCGDGVQSQGVKFK